MAPVREVAFELECFEWADERLEVAGRWKGLGNRRLNRPVLTVQTEGGGRPKRVVAWPAGTRRAARTRGAPASPGPATRGRSPARRWRSGGAWSSTCRCPDKRRRRRRRPAAEPVDEALRTEVGALRGQVERLRAELAGPRARDHRPALAARRGDRRRRGHPARGRRRAHDRDPAALATSATPRGPTSAPRSSGSPASARPPTPSARASRRTSTTCARRSPRRPPRRRRCATATATRSPRSRTSCAPSAPRSRASAAVAARRDAADRARAAAPPTAPMPGADRPRGRVAGPAPGPPAAAMTGTPLAPEPEPALAEPTEPRAAEDDADTRPPTPP